MNNNPSFQFYSVFSFKQKHNYIKWKVREWWKEVKKRFLNFIALKRDEGKIEKEEDIHNFYFCHWPKHARNMEEEQKEKIKEEDEKEVDV